MASAKRKEYLLIDGYNIIYAWSGLRKIADYSLDSARDKLIQKLQNYQGYRKNEVIVVFDAHKVAGGVGDVITYDNVTVVYTHEAETADNFIERVSREMARKYDVTVATSDNLEQVIIIGAGAKRISARELEEDLHATERKIRKNISDIKPIKNNQLLDNLDPATAALLEGLRRGEGDSKGNKGNKRK